MGVRGLTTFVNNHQEWFRPLQLKNSVLIIDGPCVFSYMCRYIHKQNYLFGGEYHELFDHLVNFFEQLKACNITPIVVIDGVSESNKTATQLKRNQENINEILTLNLVVSSGLRFLNLEEKCIFPALFKNVYIDAMKYCNVIFARSDFEGDSEAAELARAFNCPLLSYDSDFFVFDVQFVMYTRMDLSTANTHGYISCQVFNREAFYRDLSLAPGMLPVIAVLRGNDYIQWEQLKPMHQQMQGGGLLKVIEFLKGKTLNSAQTFILKTFESDVNMKTLLEETFKGYSETYTSLLPNLNEFKEFRRLKPSSAIREKTNDLDALQISSKYLQLYRNCSLGPFVIGLFLKKPYILGHSVEDIQTSSAESTCLPILQALYTILLGNRRDKPDLTICYRNKTNAAECQIAAASLEVGGVELTGEALFYSVLEINEQDQLRLHELPKTWLIFAMSLIYWMKQCKPTVRRVQVESLLLHFVFLQVVQKNISSTDLFKMFSNLNIRSEPEEAEVVDSKQSLQDLIDSVTEAESSFVAQQISAMKVPCEEHSAVEADIAVLHQFTVFQYCIYYVSQLGIILGCPFETVRVHEMYWGTLLYGLYARLKVEGENRPSFITRCFSASLKIQEIYTRTVDALNVYLPID